MKKIYIILISIGLFSCTNITIEEAPINNDITRALKKLDLLDNNETVQYFYSSYLIWNSGNFVSNYKIASYWQRKSGDKNFIKYAYYKDIDSIRIVYKDGFEFTSYLEVYPSNNNSFKAHFDASDSILNLIYSTAVDYLEKEKNSLK